MLWIHGYRTMSGLEGSIPKHSFLSFRFNILFFLPVDVPWALEVVTYMSHLELSTQHSFILGILDSELMATHCNQKDLWPRWRTELTYNYKQKYIKDIFIACPFSKATEVCSPFGPMSCSGMGFWQCWQYPVCFLPMPWVWSPTRKWLLNSITVVALMYRGHIFLGRFMFYLAGLTTS